jgi:hypothetical protein
VDIIKPSHYDDDGYVIQWARAFIPSNSLACLYALADDVRRRQALGPDVDVVVNAYEEMHTVIPVRDIIRRTQIGGRRGLVLLAGVQSNQFPRAADLARQFRAAGLAVAVGGFHVSGCLAMLPDLPPDIRAAQDMGVTLFAGEAEGRMEQLLADAYYGRLRPVYNFLNDLPDLRGQAIPMLPRGVLRRYLQQESPFDAGRGCPFQSASALSSTCRGASRATATPTTWSAWCGPTWPRASVSSSSPTTTWPATGTGKRSSTG